MAQPEGTLSAEEVFRRLRDSAIAKGYVPLLLKVPERFFKVGYDHWEGIPIDPTSHGVVRLDCEDGKALAFVDKNPIE